MEWITQIIIGAGFCAVLGVWVYQKNKEIQHLKKQLKKRSTQLQQIQAQLSAQVDESAEKLSLAQNNLEAAERAKSEFLARISYELKSPLYTILGYVQLLQSQLKDLPSAGENLESIRGSGHHLLALLSDLLEMTQLEANQMILNQSNFNLRRFLESLETTLQPQAIAKGLHLIFYLPSEVPATITADEIKLRQVLLHLLNNALKFTNSGGVTLRLGVGDRAWIMEEETVLNDAFYSLFFEVEDSGCGMTTSELEQLFEPFSLLKLESGMGLGLAISSKLIRLMGGNIMVNSDVGEGTIIKFNIAVQVGQQNSCQENLQSSSRIIGLAPNQPECRILVADDRPENRQLIIKILKPLGFQVREASNGEEAISIWSNWLPHLIWMDSRMPIMNGLAAVQQIRRLESMGVFPPGVEPPKSIIIGIISGNFAKEQSSHLKEGYDDWVRKPFEIEIILETIARHLQVRYLYEMEEIDKESPDGDITTIPLEDWANHPLVNKSAFNSEVISPSRRGRLELIKPLSRQSLQVMSAQWIREVNHSAKAGDSTQLYELIQQIPRHHEALGLGLKALLEQFNFAKIRDLTE